MNFHRLRIPLFLAFCALAAPAVAQQADADQQLRVVGFSLPTDRISTGGVAGAIQQAQASGQLHVGDMPLDEAMMRLLVQASRDAEDDLRAQMQAMDRSGTLTAMQRVQVMRQMDATHAARGRIEAKLQARELQQSPQHLTPQAHSQWWDETKQAPAGVAPSAPAATQTHAAGDSTGVGGDGLLVDAPGQDGQLALDTALARAARLKAVMQALTDAFDSQSKYLILDGK